MLEERKDKAAHCQIREVVHDQESEQLNLSWCLYTKLFGRIKDDWCHYWRYCWIKIRISKP